MSYSWHGICMYIPCILLFLFEYCGERMESAIYSEYIRQITQYPLFSFEEEIEHSKRIQKGDE